MKVSKISYEMLNKEVLLDVIMKSENNCKIKKNPIYNSNNKNECFKDFGTKRRSNFLV